MFFIMEQTILFIDSGYLSFISKHFGKGKPLRYKIEKFATSLCNNRGLTCKEIYFYIAPPYQSPKPTKEESNRKANYDKFIEKLKNVKPKVFIREGRCQKIGETYQQKGVDTLMTMDLLKTAQKRDIKSIIIITADTDFVPIINDIRNYVQEIIDATKILLEYFTNIKNLDYVAKIIEIQTRLMEIIESLVSCSKILENIRL